MPLHLPPDGSLIHGSNAISKKSYSMLKLRSVQKLPPFYDTFSYINFAPFKKKKSAPIHLRSGHQAGSSDPTSKDIYDFAVTTVFKVSI